MKLSWLWVILWLKLFVVLATIAGSMPRVYGEELPQATYEGVAFAFSEDALVLEVGETRSIGVLIPKAHEASDVECDIYSTTVDGAVRVDVQHVASSSETTGGMRQFATMQITGEKPGIVILALLDAAINGKRIPIERSVWVIIMVIPKIEYDPKEHLSPRQFAHSFPSF